MPNKPAIASMSLGRAWVHDIETRLVQASQVGFKGVEIFYECLEQIAKENGGTDEPSLLEAASKIRTLCDKLDLEIVCLQPFWFYEGLVDRAEHDAKIAKLKTWFKIAKVLRTDIIQIPSNFQPGGISGDMDLIVKDMIEVADLGLQEDPPIRFAYENLAWATYVDTWQKLWEVVTKVDRPNFGCCLDTFNIAGRVWGDPASPTGSTPNCEADLKASMQELVKTIDVKKVWYVQVVDAEKMETPLVEGHEFHVDGQPPRMSWSRNCRLFLYEEDRGGYLPAAEVARVLLKELGFEGWVSMEFFNRSMSEPGDSVPQEHARRGISSWHKLVKDLDLVE